jgi:hypothetical protein
MSEQDSEFSGGYIHKECPLCGQYCKVPKKYWAGHRGSYANSYCKRCRKKVQLSVEYL